MAKHVDAKGAEEAEARAAKRRAAIGFLREKYQDLPPEAFDIPPSMTDEEYEERIQRKFGPAAGEP